MIHVSVLYICALQQSKMITLWQPKLCSWYKCILSCWLPFEDQYVQGKTPQKNHIYESPTLTMQTSKPGSTSKLCSHSSRDFTHCCHGWLCYRPATGLWLGRRTLISTRLHSVPTMIIVHDGKMYEFTWRFSFCRQTCLFIIIAWYTWACFILHTWMTEGDQILTTQNCKVDISAYRRVHFVVVISITLRETQNKRRSCSWEPNPSNAN